MTVQSQTSRADYTGNGATTLFAVPFYFLLATDLQLLRTDNSTLPVTVTTLALGTDYTVAGAGNPVGGSVTLTVAPTGQQQLAILRIVPLTQLKHYVPNDPFPAASHEGGLDKLTMAVQQLAEENDRALTLPPTVTGVSAQLPVPSPLQLIGWNLTATGLQNADPASLATVVAFGTAKADLFSGNGVTTGFALTASPGAIANLDVSIGGVTQRPLMDYVWTAGTLLVFTTPPPVGANNVLVRYMQGLPQGVSDSAASQFVQAGSGAVLRVAQDKMRESVSVSDFGAKGDGVTDDTAAIQLAVNSTRSKKLLFPCGVYRITGPITIPVFSYRIAPGYPDAGASGGYWTMDREIDFGNSTIICHEVVGDVFKIVTGPFPANTVSTYLHSGSFFYDETYATLPTGATFKLSGGLHYGLRIENMVQRGYKLDKFIHVVNDSATAQTGYNTFQHIHADAKYAVVLEKTTGLTEFDNYTLRNITTNSTTDGGAALWLKGAPTLQNSVIEKLIIAKKGHGIFSVDGAYMINCRVNGIYMESTSATAYAVLCGMISTKLSNLQFFSVNTAAQQCYSYYGAATFSEISQCRVYDGTTGGLAYETTSYVTVKLDTGSKHNKVLGFTPRQARNAIFYVDGSSSYSETQVRKTLRLNTIQQTVTTTQVAEVLTINSDELKNYDIWNGTALKVEVLGNSFGTLGTMRWYFRTADGTTVNIPLGPLTTLADSKSFRLDATVIIQRIGAVLNLIVHRGTQLFDTTTSYVDAGRNVESRIPVPTNMKIGLYVDYTVGTGSGISIDMSMIEQVGSAA